MTFREIREKLDPTLIAYRARILYNLGYAPYCISKKLAIPRKQVDLYLEGVYCIAKIPPLPQKIRPEAAKIWGISTMRLSCSEERIKLNSLFHRKSYIPKGNKQK